MIETTARIRLPGLSVILVVLNFMITLIGVILAVMGMAGVETYIRVETSLISKGPLVGLCIFVIIIDLMYMFTKFHLGKNIDKPLTFFLLVLKYACALFLLLALIRVHSLSTVIDTTKETVCKNGIYYGSYFFKYPVSLRHIGLDVYMAGPNGIRNGCDNMEKTLSGITMALIGIGLALFAQINFMLMTTFNYRQFKKDDIIVAPRKSSSSTRRSKVKMVTKSDKVTGEARQSRRSRSVGREKDRMARSKRTNHRRNKNSRYSDSSFGRSEVVKKGENLSLRVEDVSLDDISLSDIDRYV